MRISDWSSDVCSSDLRVAIVRLGVRIGVIEHRAEAAPDRARHLEFEALVAPAVAIAAPVDLIGAIEQVRIGTTHRSEEHTSEIQSRMRISYADFCLKNKK